MKKLFSILTALICLLVACSEKKITSPEDTKELRESIESFCFLAPQINGIINSEIDKAVLQNSFSATDSIAKKIIKLENVATATPTESGTCIVVTMKDGYHYNVLVGLRNDERLFIPVSGSLREMVHPREMHLLQKQTGPSRSGEYPEGKKALILAPFQSSFQEDLNSFSKLLTDAGFTVTMYTNQEVTLQRCRGDYLANFDAILFSTHGAAAAKTIDGHITTVLSTGQKALGSGSDWAGLTGDEIASLCCVPVGDVVYWGIGVPWLKTTLTKPFPKSYFLAGACESAMADHGETSLSEFLLEHGVGGFNGYDAVIKNWLEEWICADLLANLCSGQSLKESSDNVRSEISLRGLSYFFRLFGGKKINVDLLDDDQRIEAPYYLIPSSFPYDRCQVDFFAKGHYSSTFLGEYDAYLTKSITVQGTLSNKVFKGTYSLDMGTSQDSAKAEIAIDVARHLLTGFKVSGSSVALTSTDRWSLESSTVPLAGNDSNSNFVINGSSMNGYIGPVKRTMATLANGKVVEATNLLYLIPTADSKLEFTFF